MDINYNLRKTQAVRRDIQNNERVVQKDRDAERLLNSINRHFKTTFIGSLDVFEKVFGHLWGAGIPEDDLTDEEYRYRKLWEVVRTNVLNNGNNQRRAAEAELSEYSVEWERHKTAFKFNERGNR